MTSKRQPRSTTQHAHQPTGSSVPLWLLYLLVSAAVILLHLTLLRLPYFWDEGGYYIPAAWDFFRHGTLIPETTIRNAHPPIPSILLAGWWRIFGFHVLSTRIFVALVASAALVGAFRMARLLAGQTVAFTVLSAHRYLSGVVCPKHAGPCRYLRGRLQPLGSVLLCRPPYLDESPPPLTQQHGKSCNHRHLLFTSRPQQRDRHRSARRSLLL